MRTLLIRKSKNHHDLVVLIEGNSFGDQILTLKHESKAGTVLTIAYTVNHEGNHMSHSEIKKWTKTFNLPEKNI